MSNKTFAAIILAFALGFTGFLISNGQSGSNVSAERPGLERKDLGANHVAQDAKKYGGPEPPTSGDHSQALPWQEYTQEIPDINAIHNMEHGGIYVSYQPSLPAAEIQKLRELFFEPFSRDKFSPTKVIMAPRAANDSPIIMSSWARTQKFQSFDAEKMSRYYLGNVGKSPEPTAN